MNTAQELIFDLHSRCGMTDQAIAEAVDSSQPTIWRIRTGETKDCSASLYMAIVGIHAKHCAAKQQLTFTQDAT